MSDEKRDIPTHWEEALHQQIYEMYVRPHPVWDAIMSKQPPLPPPTRRQRVMGWLRGRYWALHDRMYPGCHAWDDQ